MKKNIILLFYLVFLLLNPGGQLTRGHITAEGQYIHGDHSEVTDI